MTSSDRTPSHQAASPDRTRAGIAITDAMGTNEAIFRPVPDRPMLMTYTSVRTVVIGAVVDWRSSVREARAPATANRQASAKNPTVKKTTNHRTALDSAGSIPDHDVKET